MDAPMQEHTIEAVYGGVDWLTLTMKCDCDDYSRWCNEAYKIIAEIAKEGNDAKPASWQGYKGIRCGGMFFGSRETDSILQLSGGIADNLFHRVYTSDCNVPRLDIQMTVKYGEYQANIGREAYGCAAATNEALPQNRKRKLYEYSGSDGGYTFYLGSPTGPQRGRIYNKERQSDAVEYIRCWRYEVQYRDASAYTAAVRVAHFRNQHRNYIISSVVAWYASRGVETAKLDGLLIVDLPREHKSKTDNERKLQWLREQVAPTVRDLIEAGEYDKVHQALFGLAYGGRYVKLPD